MKVYFVLRSEPYSSNDLLGVYGSRQECLDYIEKQEGYQKNWYDYGVVESELGQEIDFCGMVDWIDPVKVEHLYLASTIPLFSPGNPVLR